MRELIELREYVTENGRNPFREWLENLKDKETLARIDLRLNRIRLGNIGDTKSVGSGVHEIRLTLGPGYRIYFGRYKDTVIILLQGGDKSSQSRDIELAQARWADYRKRTQ